MQRPVFVVGCPRSGTTLLYSMLMAAGGFAAYRKETYFYDLVPRFADLSDPKTHESFAAEYLNGYLGKVPGLDVRPFVFAALEQCRNSGDFLPRLMDGITAAQGMDRWVEATPVHVLHMDAIRDAVPDAQFVHVVRDGRDCALSNTSKQWIATLPWDRDRMIGVAALHWEWMTRAGRHFVRSNPADCFEVRFEDLVADPERTLRRIGTFLDHDLDYVRVQRNPVHALKLPNTSFRAERYSPDFNPVGRWRTKISRDDQALCDALVGPTLRELGYDSAHSTTSPAALGAARLMRAFYPNFYSTKHVLKTKTPLGRYLTSTSVWSEQPRAGEDLIEPIRAGAPLSPDSQMVAH